jgi:hypothetical protein
VPSISWYARPAARGPLRQLALDLVHEVEVQLKQPE